MISLKKENNCSLPQISSLKENKYIYHDMFNRKMSQAIIRGYKESYEMR